MLAEVAAGARGDWWIIGSTAVALHGAEVPDIRDVDLLMSARDARGFLERVGGKLGPDKPDFQFSSEVFGTWSDPPLPIEVMGNFSIASPTGWHPILPQTREPKAVDGHVLFVPSINELKQLLLSFGRPKDLERVRLLLDQA